jgi:glycosyltransferase involved in cell wall biosynthesis
MPAAPSNPAPKVSVIIPCYQSAHLIAGCLHSVLAQTYCDFETIVVNDGSPDTPELEKTLQPYMGRIVYIKQENRGPSSARNTAIRNARGKYIACLDSDDIYLPDHLSQQVELLERDGLDLTYSDSRIFRNGRPAGRAFENEPQHPPVTFEKLLKEECCVMTSATVASRQAMIDAGLFDERYRRCEDFDLWLRMSFNGARMDYYRGVGVEHRLLPGGLSADGYLLKQARIEVYKKVLTLPLSSAQHQLVRELIDWTEGKSQMDLVKRHVCAGQYEEAREAAEKAFVLLKDRKSRLAAFGLRTIPRVFGSYLRAREALRARKRQDSSAGAALEKPRGNAQLQSEGLAGRNHT